MNTQSNPRITKQYRAEITLNNVVCNVTGSEITAVQEAVRNLFLHQGTLPIAMRGKPVRFEEEQGGTTFIYHESYNETNPIGWIAENQVPEQLSIKTITEQRQRAAA